MPAFVLLTKLGETERKRPKLRAAKGKKWLQNIHKRQPESDSGGGERLLRMVEVRPAGKAARVVHRLRG